MSGITRQLADFAADLTYDDLPAEVVERTKLLIFDITGIMVRARFDAESTPSMISTVHDEAAEAAYPANMSGSVKIKTRAGEFATFVEIPKGEPGNFMSTDEFRAKFDGLCAPYLDAPRRNRLADGLLSLEDANAVASVFALSQPEGA